MQATPPAQEAPSQQPAPAGHNAPPPQEKPPEVEETHMFQCPNCGAGMHFDAAKGMLSCEHCGSTQPVSVPTNWVAQEHTDFDEGKLSLAWAGKRQISCKSCGASWVIDATDAATICPFCGQPHVTALDVTMVAPDAVIPFAVDQKQAEAKFKYWIRKRLFSPRALRDEAFAGNWRGIYYPYWTYDANTSTQYTADAGHYYYVAETRTRTVNGKQETYIEQVRYTRWERVSGQVTRFFDDILIRAVALTEKAAAPENFTLDALKPYMPEYLSGFLARRYEVGLKDGYAQATKIMEQQIHSDIVSDVHADEVNVRDANISTVSKSYKHILLPLWGNRYRYRNKQYDVWINGQNGRVSGKAPLSPWKVTLAVLLGIAACVGLVYGLTYLLSYME